MEGLVRGHRPSVSETIDEFRQITEFTDALQDMKRWLGEVGFKMQQRRQVDHGTDQDLVIDGDTLRGWLGTAMVGTGRPAATDEVRRFLDIIKRRSGLMIEGGPLPSPTCRFRSTSPPSTWPIG
jgi:hypothetical protein